MDEKQARYLEVPTKWNGKANVCVHCGRVPETFYIVTGHDHTDDEIRWCLCRKPLTPKKSEREAELEAEVMRLRSVMADVIKAHGYAGGTPIEVLSTPFTPTALHELIEKVSEVTRQRAISAGSAINPIYGAGAAIDAIRALPVGQIDLKEIL